MASRSNAVDPQPIVDPLHAAERAQLAAQPERSQKIFGALAILLVLGAVASIPFLPTSTYRSVYEVCGAEGISRETVNQAMAVMRNSRATREEKLAGFLANFKPPRNDPGIQSCGREILRESEKGK
jgi:hypothetical protein